MLCSIPTSRSSSGWLDRLHTSKGFRVPSDLDLEQFLHSDVDTNPNPNPTPPKDVGLPASSLPDHRKNQQSRKRMGCEKEQCLFDLMTNVLSELFVMGEPQESTGGRKNARKQMNPRLCVSSVSASAEVGVLPHAPAMSPSSADNSIAQAKKDRKKMKRMRVKSGKPGSDPSANTGTIVTVIDTSSPEWKTERHFRKGTMWKGKEKELNVCKKKRKLGLVDELKVEKVKLLPLTELKVSEQNKSVKSHNEGFTPEDSAEGSDYHIQMPRRPKFLRSPRLPVKNSSLFRLHVVTKNHKSGVSDLGGAHKVKS